MDVAVIVPTKGRPAMVVQAVQSVLEQTHPAAEIVVVMDGADRATRDVLDALGVRAIESPGKGVSDARNAGIAATDADWLCFLDDDDLWHPRRLERTAAYLNEHPDALAVHSASWLFASDPKRAHDVDFVAADYETCITAAESIKPRSDWSYLDITGRSYDLLLERNRGNISGATARRDVVARAGNFPAERSCAEDWTMFVNVARFTEWHYLPDRLSFVRIHDGNNTRRNAAYNGLETLRAIQAVWSEMALPEPAHRPLGAYAADYRYLTRVGAWSAARRGRLDVAVRTLRAGWSLLPRWRDRVYCLVPSAVTR